MVVEATVEVAQWWRL